MKTAISIPDDLFETAERTAKRFKISRSELYQRAIKKYVDDLDENSLLQNLNNTYSKEESTLDRTMESMQFNTIKSGTQDDSW